MARTARGSRSSTEQRTPHTRLASRSCVTSGFIGSSDARSAGRQSPPARSMFRRGRWVDRCGHGPAKPCTNGLGSRVEAELIDWRDDALRHARTVSEEVLGARKLPRLLRRRTPDGRFVLMVDGPLHPDVKLMLQGQDFALQFTPPDPNRYKLAALKHAYWLNVCT